MTKVYYGELKNNKSRNSLMIALSPCVIHQACKIKRNNTSISIS